MLSISVSLDTLKKIEDPIREGRFRNKSHALERAFLKLLEIENERS